MNNLIALILAFVLSFSFFLPRGVYRTPPTAVRPPEMPSISPVQPPDIWEAEPATTAPYAEPATVTIAPYLEPPTVMEEPYNAEAPIMGEPVTAQVYAPEYPMSALEELVYMARSNYIVDEYGILSQSQLEALESDAGSIAVNYPCEAWIFIIDDMRDYGYYDLEELSSDIYHTIFAERQEYGDDNNCFITILSMAERDYDVRVWGAYANFIIASGIIDILVDDYLLPKLKDNEYYSALSQYLEGIYEYLEDSNL